MATVTCRTPNCSKEGEPVPDVIVTVTDDETGETRPVDYVVCGACGQEITDVVE